MVLLSIDDACRWCLEPIVKLYFSDPTEHVYLLYDLMYELGRSRIYVRLGGSEVKGYLLIWYGPLSNSLIIWGSTEELIRKYVTSDLLEELTKKRLVVQVRGDGLDIIVGMLTRLGIPYELRYYYDMIVDNENFKPYKPELAIRLNHRNEDHIREFIRIKEVEGIRLGKELAVKFIRNYLYHGIFLNGHLASIACTYVRLNDVWIIGDVFTDPRFRGRGLAKAVTSAITKLALKTGAVAELHVEITNKPAIKVYQKLGYKTLREVPWIISHINR